MIFNVFGSLIDGRPQPENAVELIVFNPGGNTTLVKSLLLANALVPIVVTVLGIITLFIPIL